MKSQRDRILASNAPVKRFKDGSEYKGSPNSGIPYVKIKNKNRCK